MRRLIMTVGLPRSGKSTWAKSTGYPMVNPDSIRLALHGIAYEKKAEKFVWAIAETMIRSLFIAGHENVILDATNTTAERQLAYEYLTEELDICIWYKVFMTHAVECMVRADQGGRYELIPVIQRMAKQFEPPPLNRRL